jgi:hypothetical protein
MSEWSYKRNGQHRYAAYRQDHCVRMRDILHEGFGYSRLKSSLGNTARVHQCNSKRTLAAKLIHEFLELMVDDLIEKGNVYKLPIQQGGMVRIVRKTDRAIRSISRRGAYKGVDLIESDFNIYEMVFDFQARGKLIRRYIQLDRARYGRLVEKVNRGEIRYQNGF